MAVRKGKLFKLRDLVLGVEENLPTNKGLLGRTVEVYYRENKKNQSCKSQNSKWNV